MDCKLCSYHNDDLKRFSDHVKTSHGLSSEEYTIKVFHDDIKPTCAECGNQVRYVSFTFKKYCKDHSRLAMKEGGAIGGHAESWNKGKDKTTDERIALQSSKMLGSGNHFYGRRHTQETIQKISISKTLATLRLKKELFRGQENCFW